MKDNIQKKHNWGILKLSQNPSGSIYNWFRTRELVSHSLN